jgi:hypothetical protein
VAVTATHGTRCFPWEGHAVTAAGPYKESETDMSSPEETPSKEFVEEQLKTIVHYIEQHIQWAKSDDNHDLARLHMVTAESLIESARLIKTLCERLSEE